MLTAYLNFFLIKGFERTSFNNFTSVAFFVLSEIIIFVEVDRHEKDRVLVLESVAPLVSAHLIQHFYENFILDMSNDESSIWGYLKYLDFIVHFFDNRLAWRKFLNSIFFKFFFSFFVHT